MGLKDQVKKYFPVVTAIKNSLRINSFKIKHKSAHSKIQSSYEGAIRWLKTNQLSDGGIAISSKQKKSYVEVTGYIVPTLYNWGERMRARELVNWLITQQNEDGSFSAPDGTPYTFDTGQVLRGLLSALDDCPQAKEPLIKGCDWILTQIDENGKLNTPSTDMWGTIADDRIHLYCLPPLVEAAEKLNKLQYSEAAQKVLHYYKQKDNLTEFNTLSHFCAYVWEALCDLGETELASQAVSQAVKLQNKDGSVPAYRDCKWICTTGVAQIAVIGYKLGMFEFADKALQYMMTVQNRSGGFQGSLGSGANYFAGEENSWTVKYFLDAYYWRQKTLFNRASNDFPSDIDEKDDRVQAIMKHFGDINGKKILDAGCGAGRYLSLLDKKFPQSDLYGLDISSQLLERCPKKVKTQSSSLLEINFPDNYFDCVYCVEALEHALRIEAAIKEMVRVLKPSGRLVIIDKNEQMLGKIPLESWEQWFDPQQLTDLLRNHGVSAQFKPIGYDQNKSDGLFYVWEGIKQ